jgi:hypothetical protein
MWYRPSLAPPSLSGLGNLAMLVSFLSRARRFVPRLRDSFRNLLERPHSFIVRHTEMTAT